MDETEKPLRKNDTWLRLHIEGDVTLRAYAELMVAFADLVDAMVAEHTPPGAKKMEWFIDDQSADKKRPKKKRSAP